MAKGTVKWFNQKKGYGFILPKDGGKDVFVHISAVERAGLQTLKDGMSIEYEVVENRGRIVGELESRSLNKTALPAWLVTNHWASSRTCGIHAFGIHQTGVCEHASVS